MIPSVSPSKAKEGPYAERKTTEDFGEEQSEEMKRILIAFSLCLL